MMLYIDDDEVEQLAKELADLMGTTIDEAVRAALIEAIERFKAETPTQTSDEDTRG